MSIPPLYLHFIFLLCLYIPHLPIPTLCLYTYYYISSLVYSSFVLIFHLLLFPLLLLLLVFSLQPHDPSCPRFLMSCADVICLFLCLLFSLFPSVPASASSFVIAISLTSPAAAAA